MTEHRTATNDIHDQAISYSLGLLEPGEVTAFEAHLKECGVCASEVRAFGAVTVGLAQAIPEARPHPRVREEVLRRAGPERILVRAGDGAWQTPFPGVGVKQLFVDPVTRNVTWMVRMAPGAKYPSHRHAGNEHCYVLEGDLAFNDHTLHAGDYEVASASTGHSVTTTTSGCLLLIINNERDEVFA